MVGRYTASAWTSTCARADWRYTSHCHGLGGVAFFCTILASPGGLAFPLGGHAVRCIPLPRARVRRTSFHSRQDDWSLLSVCTLPPRAALSSSAASADNWLSLVAQTAVLRAIAAAAEATWQISSTPMRVGSLLRRASEIPCVQDVVGVEANLSRRAPPRLAPLQCTPLSCVLKFLCSVPPRHGWSPVEFVVCVS